MVLHPNQTQSSGAFSYTVKTIEITPVTTRPVLDSQGNVPSTPEQSGEFSATKMYYDIVDQDGKPLDQKMIGYFHQNPKTEYRGRNLQPVYEETDLYYDQAVYDDGQ
ncbi:DUF5643 domain-containing protein [Paenibacillus sp. JTLBN-2024]